jgi:hypothetical protein
LLAMNERARDTVCETYVMLRSVTADW